MRLNLTLPLIDQGQPRVIIYINFVELESLMLHTKFQDHRTSGSGEDFFRDVYHIWAWRPSCHVTWTIYLLYPLSKEAPHKIWL